MRVSGLTLQYSGLILLLVWGFFTTLVTAAERFTGSWRAGGLLPLLMIVAVEALVTQRLVARERRRFEEQLGVRAIELAVIVVLVRVWSLLTESGSLLVNVGPWLREPLTFFGGRFLEYFLWSFAAWSVATVLAIDVIGWSDDSLLTAPPESAIDLQQIQEEWETALTRYRQHYLSLTVVSLAASAFALSNLGRGAEPPTGARAWLPAAGAIVGLVAGLLLHSAGRLSQLRRNWIVDNIDIEAGISRRWGRFGFLLVVALALMAPVVGWAVLIAPPPPLVPVVNALLVVMTMTVSLVILVFGLLLSPLIFLLSLFTGGESGPAPVMPQIQPPQIAEIRGDRPLWPALIFWGCVLALIAIAFVRYLEGRSDLRAALRSWRWIRWLLDLFGEWWSDTRGWIGLAATSLRRLAPRRRSRRPLARPDGPHAQLRALYRRMRQAGARRGIVPRLAQTPFEYSTELSRSLSAAEGDVKGLTDAYVVAEYGPRPAGPGELERARRHWRRLQRWLLSSASMRLRRTPPGSRHRGSRNGGAGSDREG